MIEDRIKEIEDDAKALRDLAYGDAQIRGDIPKIGGKGGARKKVLNRPAFELLERMDEQLSIMHKRRINKMDQILEKKRPRTSQESS